MVRHALAAAAAALVLVLALPASAGIVMEFQDKGPGDPAPAVSKAWATNDRVRMEVGGQTIIFRGDKQVAWILQPDNTYMELTKDGIPGMAEAMKEMQAQMASLPPEQRAMMEQMMKGQGAGAPAAPKAPATTWAANGTSDTVAGTPCKGWDGTTEGRVTEQVCAADWTAFGLTMQDFRGFQAFADFMKSMSGPMAQAMQGRGNVVEESIPGVPLRTISKTPQGQHVHEVTKLQKADVPGSLFELPAGARAEAME